MFNVIFFVAMTIGFFFRVYDGRIISIAAGLCAGVVLNELWKFIVYVVKSL